MKEKSTGTVIVDFSKFPFCFRNTKCKKYTNMLKDENEFFEKFKELIEKLLPHICSKTFDELINDRMHCHIIKSEDMKLVYEVVGEMVSKWNPDIDVEEFLKQNLDGEKIWQLGFESIRLIGIREDNLFHVLFIDYYHLIYPSVKYNDKDYKKYKFEVIK